MTSQEALEIVTNIIQSSKVTKKTDMACAIAQKALKKQIPQKVIEKVDELNDKDYNGLIKRYYCPHCHYEIDEYSSPVGCKFCLQTLDWKNESDN